MSQSSHPPNQTGNPAMDDIPFDLEACTEHSSGAQLAALYLHELFNTGREEEAMKLGRSEVSRVWN